MEKSYRNIHLLLHDLYKSGGNLMPHGEMLLGSARSMFDRATISGNLSRAKALRRLVDRELRDGSAGSTEARELFELLSECFSVLVDDVILLSAFEMYVKSVLLTKQCVIHPVKAPTALRKQQRRHPLSITLVRDAVAQGDRIEFNEKTLSVGIFLNQQSYRDLISLSPVAQKGMHEIHRRRNLIHLATAYAWSVSDGLLEAVEHLDSVLPRR